MLLDMNADVVYQVAKALSREEQKLLLDKLKKDFSMPYIFKKERKKMTLNREEVITYLLQNVFRNKTNH